MKTIENKKMFLPHDDGGNIFQNLSFNECIFDNCSLSLSKNIEMLSTIKNVTLSNCQAKSCIIGPSYLKNVLIDNLNTGDILLIWSALFDHVTLKGKIGNIKINNSGFDLYDKPEIQKKLDSLRQDFYSKTDWALDISEAKFLNFSCEGIPADIIKRDNKTQVVIKREKFNSIEMLDSNFQKEHSDLYFILQMFLRSQEEDIVLITPLGRDARYHKPIFDGLMKLRKMGIAEEN
ncbi:hypothetical protein [Flavobacterium ginsengiterrae]|uniref:Pentapeptide repeat protein n=1 Tax=Flavobacterium ginsengiterrae TaxID=871695 RepID=A0ABP7GE40_9FLAO